MTAFIPTPPNPLLWQIKRFFVIWFNALVLGAMPIDLAGIITKNALRQRILYFEWQIKKLPPAKIFSYYYIATKIQIIKAVLFEVDIAVIFSKVLRTLKSLTFISMAILWAWPAYSGLWKKRKIGLGRYIDFNIQLVRQFLRHPGRMNYFSAPIPMSDPVFVPWYNTYESIMRCIWTVGKRPPLWELIVGFPRYLMVFYALFLCHGQLNLQKDCYKALLRKARPYRFFGYLGLADLEHLFAGWHEEISWYHVRNIYFNTETVYGRSMNDPVSRLEQYSYARALRYYRKALSLYPGQFFALEQTGIAYKDAGNYQAALNCYASSVKANPHNMTASIRLAQMQALLLPSPQLLAAAGDVYVKTFARTGYNSYWKTPIVAEVTTAKSACERESMPYVNTISATQMTYNYRISYRGDIRDHTVNLQFDPGYIAELEDAVDIHYGFMLTKSMYLLEDTKHLASRNLKFFSDSVHEVLQDRAFVMLPELLHASEPEAIILPGFFPNYHHWLIDCLGSLANFEHHRNYDHIPIAFAGNLTSWQRDSLRLLGINQDRVIELGQTRPYYVQHAVLPSLLSRYNISHPAAVRFLRKKLVRHVPRVTPGKRIFITRRNLRGRQIENEQKLIDMVKRYGVSVVDTSGWTFEEQIDYFKDVELVIAPGGAALTNLLFCPEACKAIILSSDKSWVETFSTITAELGIKTWVCIGESSVPVMTYYLWTSFDSTPIESEVERCIKEALNS